MSRKYYIYFMENEDEEDVVYLVICPKNFWDTNKFIPDEYILKEDTTDKLSNYYGVKETDDEILELLETLELDNVGDWAFEKFLSYSGYARNQLIKILYKKLIDSGLCEFSETFVSEMNEKFPNKKKVYLP